MIRDLVQRRDEVRPRDPDRLHAGRQGADDDRGRSARSSTRISTSSARRSRSSSSSCGSATRRSGSATSSCAARAAERRGLRHAAADAGGARRSAPRPAQRAHRRSRSGARDRSPRPAPSRGDRRSRVHAGRRAGWSRATTSCSGAALIGFAVVVLLAHGAVSDLPRLPPPALTPLPTRSAHRPGRGFGGGGRAGIRAA